MKTPASRIPLRCLTALLLAIAPAVGAQNIYKCTRAGQLVYTDRPCPAGTGELIHQADDSEVIDQYLRLGQETVAKRYAESHHLEALYRQRLAAYQRTMDERARREADDAAAAQQHAEEARQQALADEAANRERLQTENEALRQQNEAYKDQLNQPVYNPPPAYWAPYPDRHDGHGGHGNHRPPPSREPAYHPCTQLAGGRTQC